MEDSKVDKNMRENAKKKKEEEQSSDNKDKRETELESKNEQAEKSRKEVTLLINKGNND